jgi:hypothetical protein
LKAADLNVALPKLPVDRTYDAAYGQPVELSPLIRRVCAQNPNAFTFKGTGTYIVGRGQVAVIDPGPLLDAHVEALLKAVKGETVTHILISKPQPARKPTASAPTAPARSKMV